MKPHTRLLLALVSVFSLSALSPVWASAAPGGAADLIADGMRLLEQGKLEPAQKAFEAAVRADPRSVDATMKLAGVNIAQNNFTAAIALYKRAIALNPNNAKAFIGMGIAYLHSGDKSMSRALFEEALRLEPGRKDQLAPIMAKLSVSD
jgi:cytochrome c-type biogenesis protein CcmH/NrfG